MPKGDDALRRKKKKLVRKKMRADTCTSNVSSRIAGIIASKQRRKAGKRRKCEGMCFSLPSPDDPFNDNNGLKNFNKPAPSETEAGASVTQKGDASRKVFSSRQRDPQKDKSKNVLTSLFGKYERNTVQKVETKDGMLGKGGVIRTQRRLHGSSDGPSKFLTACLKSIQNTLLDKSLSDRKSENSLLLNQWGAEFLTCSLLGTDILETTGGCSSEEQIAWMVSIAADIIAIKEKEGLSVPNPFLLILVPSKEKAIQVRLLCKPLKALGIHTVSLHTGASLDHQIDGLKCCEPEFIISTPERLLELVSLKAIDISGLSFLVVDGLKSFAISGLLDNVNSIRQATLGASLTVVFCDSFGPLSTSAVQSLLGGPISRLSLSDSIASQSACISQCVHMCTPEEKPSKGIHVLNQECGKRTSSDHHKVLFVEEISSKARSSAAALIAEGYAMSNDTSDCLEVAYCKETTTVTVTDLEHVHNRTDMGEFEIVVVINFPPEIDDYVEILTRMARQSVNGVLHCCFCQEDASLAGPLIDILEQCEQNVPEFLRSYHNSVSMSEH
ncbi:hypothetical protein IFM89_015264 [Coptis chinensis]|uniref:DEAD/DEAH-box helicase domain-containing protein n=1 Tax=Coptis chinensis TaxID=261450 RepID=A0A835HHQ1_9MAGN|nr:hypothetical protein IFM89_015264 [Coptis chinensis]